MQTDQKAPEEPFEFLTVDEVGQRLRIGPEKVMDLITSSRLEALRLGRRCVRIRADSVERLING
jgi:excisionase family DNA binding protein